MKIAIITNLYPPFNRGGAEIVVSHIAQEFTQQNHDVCVITTHDRKGLDCETIDGITFYRFLPLNLFYYLEDYKYGIAMRMIWRVIDVFNIQSAYTVYNILKKEKPDIVYTHNLVGLGFLIPYVISKLHIMHVHTLHDVQLIEPSGILYTNKKNNQSQTFYNSSFYKILRKGYRFIVRKLFKTTDIVITPSEYLMIYHKKYSYFPYSHYITIKNPLLISHKPATTGKRHSYRLELLFIGQIEEHKGIEFLLNVIETCDPKKISLTIVGNGSLLSELKQKYKRYKNIHFIGRINHSQVQNYILQSDFVVVPSLCVENSPTVIYESYFMGRPVIGSCIGGIPELIQNKKNGFVFETGDKKDLLKTLNHVQQLSQDEYKNLCENAEKTVKDLTLEKYIKRITQLS